MVDINDIRMGLKKHDERLLKMLIDALLKERRAWRPVTYKVASDEV